MSWRALNPENSGNPFDTIGLYHNEALDHVLSGFLKLPVGSKQETSVPLSLADMVSEFLYYRSGKNDIGELEEIVNACYIAIGRSFAKRNGIALINTKASAPLQGYYSQLYMVLPYTDINNIADKLAEIRNLEKNIGSSGMSEDEKRIAFWISSVARFSLAYWTAEFYAEKSLWVSTAVQIGGWRDLPVKMAAGPPPWVLSDIEGAFMAAFSTANPFVALGWGAVGSAYTALKDHGVSNGWW